MTNKVGFRKNISTFSLTMTGVTTIIGSGWLLSTQKIAEIAGPASLVSWIVGALIALLVGLFFIEMGSQHPTTGGIGYYSHLTHGRFCGFLTSWINWLSIVAVAPIEAQGIVQYLSQINTNFAAYYDVSSHNLTSSGTVFALFLMLFFMFINYWSVQLFIRFNNFFTVIKVAIPLLTIGVLTYSGLHTENFGHTLQEFMPNGMSSVFVSVVACGVVMSFNGFQSPLNFSEEISNPKKQLPIAVIGSIALAFFVYMLLQAVFIGNVDPKTAALGWGNINYRSPYITLLLLANMQIMVTLVYAGAVISPAACGAAFIASSSRIMHSLSREGHLPPLLSQLHPTFRNPRYSIIACTLVGCIFLFGFKGWYSLVTVVSILHIFSYLPAPIVTIANRLKLKHNGITKNNHFVMPFANLLAAPLLFVLSILIFYSAWPLVIEMALLIIPGLVFYFFYEYKDLPSFWVSLKGALWLIIHIVGISTITFLGNNKSGNLISLKTSMVLIAFLSLVTYISGAYFSFAKEMITKPELVDEQSKLAEGKA